MLVGKEATKETLEDYTLRFAPRHYRRWTPGVVAISALGGIAYLADFAIGANIGISYGTVNALWGILVFAVVIFLTGFPLAYYAARYNLHLDLITRGSGFGYYGSVVTNVIFATFTFIFFAADAEYRYVLRREQEAAYYAELARRIALPPVIPSNPDDPPEPPVIIVHGRN